MLGTRTAHARPPIRVTPNLCRRHFGVEAFPFGAVSMPRCATSRTSVMWQGRFEGNWVQGGPRMELRGRLCHGPVARHDDISCRRVRSRCDLLLQDGPRRVRDRSGTARTSEGGSWVSQVSQPFGHWSRATRPRGSESWGETRAPNKRIQVRTPLRGVPPDPIC
jgi:hypothetical protein